MFPFESMAPVYSSRMESLVSVLKVGSKPELACYSRASIGLALKALEKDFAHILRPSYMTCRA